MKPSRAKIVIAAVLALVLAGCTNGQQADTPNLVPPGANQETDWLPDWMSSTSNETGPVVALRGHATPEGWLGLYLMPPGYDRAPAFTLHLFVNETDRSSIQQVGYLALEWNDGIDVSSMWIRSKTSNSAIEDLESVVTNPIEDWGSWGQLNYRSGLDEDRPWALLFFAKAERASSFHIGLLPGADYSARETEEATIVSVAKESGWHAGQWSQQGSGYDAATAQARLADPATPCDGELPKGDLEWFGNLEVVGSIDASGCEATVRSSLSAPGGQYGFLHWDAAFASVRTELVATLHGANYVAQFQRLPGGLATIHDGEPGRQGQNHYLASKGSGGLELEVVQHLYGPWSAVSLFDLNYVSMDVDLESWLSQPARPCFVRGNPLDAGIPGQSSTNNGYCTGTLRGPR